MLARDAAADRAPRDGPRREDHGAERLVVGALARAWGVVVPGEKADERREAVRRREGLPDRLVEAIDPVRRLVDPLAEGARLPFQRKPEPPEEHGLPDVVEQ